MNRPDMSKEYITTIIQIYPEKKSKLQRIKAGDEIVFHMPSFCSGDYVEQVKEDDIGLYVSNWYRGCRGWSIRRNGCLVKDIE